MLEIIKSNKNFIFKSNRPLWRGCLNLLKVEIPVLKIKGKQPNNSYSLRKVPLDILEMLESDTKHKYRQLAKQIHPDKNATIDSKGNVILNNTNHELFKDITYANSYLKIWFKKEFERKI